MIPQILAMTWKDLKILLKDSGGLATLFLMPVMFIFVMTLALGGLFSEGEDLIELLVVNQDEGATGAQLVADLSATDGWQVETSWEGEVLTRTRAEELIVAGTRTMAVVIPAGFSQATQASLFGSSEGETAAVAQLDLIVDPALSQQFVAPVRGALAGLSQQAAFLNIISPRGIDLFLDDLSQDDGVVVPDETRERLRQETIQVGDSSGGTGIGTVVEINETQPAGMEVEQLPNAVQQNVPGWTLFGVFFISQILASSLLEEKKVGSFRRLLAAPMSRATLLLGKLLPFLIVNLIQITLMFAVGVLVLPLLGAPRLELGLHPAGLVVISVATALAATGLGLLVASLAKTQDQIGGLGSLLVVTMAALGGVMVPRFVMPDFMQTLGLVTPHAWALTAYQDVLVRGYDVAGILPEFAALMGFAAVFFVVALWRFRWD